MGGASSFTITSFPFFLTITTLILIHLSNTVIAGSNGESNQNGIHVTRDDDNGSPPTAAGHGGKKWDTALKPSAAVVVGVLTTTFSLSFLLLLYIKHCSRGATLVARGDRNPQGGAASSEQRKHSGVCREVVESLPMFQFGSLRGRKNGLDCAVCLAGFEELEVLRLLPKCKHAFHIDCVDTWLSAHSTCPLCRYKVHGEDVALAEDAREEEASDIERGRRNNDGSVSPENENLRASGRGEASDIERGRNNDGSALPGHENRRASGREEASDIERGRNNVGSASPGNEHRRATGSNSSAEFLEIVLHTPKNDTETSSFRGSSEEVVASPGKNGGSLGGRMSGERRLDHRIIVSPASSHGADYKERSNGDEPVDVLYLRSEMIIRDGRRTASVSEHGHDVGNDETEDGVLRCVSETTGMSRFLRGKNRGRKGGNVGAGSR